MQGQALSVASTLANSQPLNITDYQWQSSNGLDGWTDIAGATQASFTPRQCAAGLQLRVRVSFTDAVGTGQQAVSPATAAVTGAAASVLIDGTPTEDQTLTANTIAVTDPQGLGSVQLPVAAQRQRHRRSHRGRATRSAMPTWASRSRCA